MQKHSDSTTSWSFDVSYVNVAAGSVYGYAIAVPLAFYFLLQYLGSNASLVRFWCLWGYSLSVFVLASVSCCFSTTLSLPLSFSFFFFVQWMDRLEGTYVCFAYVPSAIFEPWVAAWNRYTFCLSFNLTALFVMNGGHQEVTLEKIGDHQGGV
jgi:hypothetical protein